MPRPPRTVRSPLSILLLLLLRETPAPSHYIAFHLGEDPRKVSTYLGRLRRYGFVRRDEYGLWYLTDEGRDFVEKLEESLFNVKIAANRVVQLFSNLLELQQKSTEINRNPQKSTQSQHLSAHLTVLERAERLLGRRLKPVERALITYLYEFTRKTGRKYWWPPEPVPLDLALAEELARSSGSSIDVSPSEVRRALRELESRGILYITHDRRRGVAKVRLSRSLDESGDTR